MTNLVYDKDCCVRRGPLPSVNVTVDPEGTFCVVSNWITDLKRQLQLKRGGVL